MSFPRFAARHFVELVIPLDANIILEAGLNHIRIPIGYWAYDVSGGEPFIQGAAEYLDRAIGWARKYNVKVSCGICNRYEWVVCAEQRRSS